MRPWRPDRQVAPVSGGASQTTDEADLLFAVQEVLQGNLRAFATIVERYTPGLFSLARRYGNTTEQAEEAVQDIFVKIYQALGRFQISRRLGPWVYKIALNHLRSLYRRRNRKRRLSLVRMDETALVNLADTKEADPAETLLRREGEALVREALGGLRRIQREVFVLRVLEGLSVGEVAATLGIPEGTVKTHTHRARKHLMEVIAGDGDPDERIDE
jgi:RNA polymerase sigma-70 factor (ECF subfamily)